MKLILALFFLFCIAATNAASATATVSWTPTGTYTATGSSSWTATASSSWTATTSVTITPSTTSTASGSMTSTTSFPALAGCDPVINNCPTQGKKICPLWTCPTLPSPLVYDTFKVYNINDLTTPIATVDGSVFTAMIDVTAPATTVSVRVQGTILYNGVAHFTDFSLAYDLTSGAANEKQDSTLAAGNDFACALETSTAADNGGVGIKCTWTNGDSTRFFRRANAHLTCFPQGSPSKGANPIYNRDKRFFHATTDTSTPTTQHIFWGIPTNSKCHAFFRAYYPRDSRLNFRSKRFDYPAIGSFFTV